MTNRVATGQSSARNTRQAVEEALTNAMRGLGQAAQLAFVFASPEHDLAAATGTASRMTGAQVVGSTTAGQFTEAGPTAGHGLAVLLLATSDVLLTRHASAEQLEGGAGPLASGWLELSRESARNDHRHAMSVLLVDGLSGIGPGLADALRHSTRPYHEMVGGAAGDDMNFRQTKLAVNGAVIKAGAIAVHLFSKSRWEVGTALGLSPEQARSIVTASDGCTLERIDDLSAFDYYRRHAAQQGIQLQRATAGSYLNEHQLGLFFLDKLQCARAPLEVLESGAIRYAGPVPRGTSVCILKGEKAGILAAAESACRAAVSTGKPAGLLVFGCVCRKAILGPRFGEEVDAIRRTAGADVPFAGFYTYGEIARPRGKMEGWHNSTLVVAAIPQA